MQHYNNWLAKWNDINWLLNRINNLQNIPNRLPDHRTIWQGSYDVWHCEQDKIDAVEIPKARMKEAEDLGLIKSYKHEWKLGKFEVVWSLTESAKRFL